MRSNAAHNIKLPATVTAIALFFLFCSANTLLAVTMPAYERLQSFSEVVADTVQVLCDTEFGRVQVSVSCSRRYLVTDVDPSTCDVLHNDHSTFRRHSIELAVVEGAVDHR